MGSLAAVEGCKGVKVRVKIRDRRARIRITD